MDDMMRTTDRTVGLLIANAANEGVIRHQDAEHVVEILDAIGMAAEMEIEEGKPDSGRRSLLQHRTDLCAGIRDALERRLRSDSAPDGDEDRRLR